MVWVRRLDGWKLVSGVAEEPYGADLGETARKRLGVLAWDCEGAWLRVPWWCRTWRVALGAGVVLLAAVG